MWMIFGASAILCTILNLVWMLMKKNPAWFRFAGLAFTALTVCAFYADGAVRVAAEDWGGLTDVMPTVSLMLWICTAVSILLNSVSLFSGMSGRKQKEN